MNQGGIPCLDIDLDDDRFLKILPLPFAHRIRSHLANQNVKITHQAKF